MATPNHPSDDYPKDAKMSREHAGQWQAVTRCVECGWVTDKEVKWFDVFFVTACPGCGEPNRSGMFAGGTSLFEGLIARPIRVGIFRRFDRWEFKPDSGR